MTRRIVSFFVVLCILYVSSFPVHATKTDTQKVPNYEKYCNFTEGAYTTYFHEKLYLSFLNGCSDLDGLIKNASMLIGENLSVKRCTEILSNMATLMNYQLEDAIVAQAEYDTTKTLLDYGIDATKIAAGLINTDLMKKCCNSAMARITTAIGITNGAMEFTVNTIDELSLLIQLEGDYSMQYNFLESVYMYSDIPEMQEAAQLLISANKQIMYHKLETFTSAGNNLSKFAAHDIFLDQVANELLESPDFWDSEMLLPLTALCSVYSIYSTTVLAFDTTMFIGDLLFDTSDIYNRYNEMIAMRDIRNALRKRIAANPVLSETDYDTMDHNISFMKMALYIDARGEYCVFKMLTEAEEKLSKFAVATNEKSLEENYHTSIRIIEKTLNILDEIYDIIDLQTTTETRLLIQAVQRYSDGSYHQHNFSYNQAGLLSEYSLAAHSDFGDVTHKYLLSYDTSNRLIQYKDTAEDQPSRKYHYSQDGTLTGWSLWEAGHEIRYICEYDEQDRLIKEYAKNGSHVSNYVYDDSGLLICKTTNTESEVMSGTSTTTYTYDDQNRLVEEVVDSVLWGTSTQSTIRYIYDYAPFVLQEYYRDGKWEPRQLTLQAGVPNDLVSFRLDSSAKFESKDGWLIKIISNEHTYEFTYDDSMISGSTPTNSTTDIISENEAYQIACKYWKYTEGDVSPETGYELFVKAEYGNPLRVDPKTGKQYYCYMLQWLVPGGSGTDYLATCDIVYIDAKTGDCPISIN